MSLSAVTYRVLTCVYGADGCDVVRFVPLGSFLLVRKEPNRHTYQECQRLVCLKISQQRIGVGDGDERSEQGHRIDCQLVVFRRGSGAGICCQSNGDPLVCGCQGSLQHTGIGGDTAKGYLLGSLYCRLQFRPPLVESAERDNWMPLGELGGLWREVIHGIVGGDLDFRPFVHVFHPYAFWRLRRNVSGVSDAVAVCLGEADVVLVGLIVGAVGAGPTGPLVVGKYLLAVNHHQPFIIDDHDNFLSCSGIWSASLCAPYDFSRCFPDDGYRPSERAAFREIRQPGL